jgi:microtubule-associated protein-like 6
MAVKPWLGAIKEPSEVKKIPHADKKPKCTITLDYVYGYRCKDTRNNLRYITDTKVVYHAAAVGIVHDIETNTQ